MATCESNQIEILGAAENFLGSTSIVVNASGTTGSLPGMDRSPVAGDEWIDPNNGDRYVFDEVLGWQQAPCCYDSWLFETATSATGAPVSGPFPVASGETLRLWSNTAVLNAQTGSVILDIETPTNTLGTSSVAASGLSSILPGMPRSPIVGDEWIDPSTGNGYIYSAITNSWQGTPVPPSGIIVQSDFAGDTNQLMVLAAVNTGYDVPNIELTVAQDLTDAVLIFNGSVRLQHGAGTGANFQAHFTRNGGITPQTAYFTTTTLNPTASSTVSFFKPINMVYRIGNLTSGDVIRVQFRFNTNSFPSPVPAPFGADPFNPSNVVIPYGRSLVVMGNPV